MAGKQDLLETVGLIFNKLDADGSGDVSEEEFVHGVTSDDMLWDAFEVRQINPSNKSVK